MAAGALVAVGVVALSGLLHSGPRALTKGEVDNAIRQALASATAKPNVAIAAYENIRKSVVEVKTRSGVEPVAESRGAGVVLDTAGSILTSLHIVQGASEIRVVFADGTETPAVVTGSQQQYDVALIEPESPPVPVTPAVLSSPKTLRIGDEAIVVGSPFGFPNSVSAGIVSGLNRSFQPSWQREPLRGLIQFDAAVSPGHSGGPLVNRRGEVVGIVTVPSNAAGLNAFIGVGFAVPIDSAALAAGSNPF